MLDELLVTTEDYQRSDYNALKAPPKKPTITNFRELLKYHDWLLSFGDLEPHVKRLLSIKLKQFAEQARCLDVSDLKDFSKKKRYALIGCLLFQAQTRVKDTLAITFEKILQKMHKSAKIKLENQREYYRLRTQELLVVFSDVLDTFEANNNQAKFKEEMYKKLEDHGGTESLKIDCEQAVALNSNNHFSFLLDLFKTKRRVLFNLIKTLDIRSSTQQTSLLKAKQYIIKAVWLEKTIKSNMKERNLIDVLCSSQYYCGWAYELGPISGDEPKIKNPIKRSDIIHGDTQAQSTVVFALAYLLGFRLMPRIRNWKSVKLFKPNKDVKYKNNESLFSDTINWELIKKTLA